MGVIRGFRGKSSRAGVVAIRLGVASSRGLSDTSIAGLSTESFLVTSPGTAVLSLSTGSSLLHLLMKLRNNRG